MTERDRLYDIIKNMPPEVRTEEEVTDYLLDNGIIAPPCKVGDKVYLIPLYGGKPYCGIRLDKVQMIGITSRGYHIKAREHHDHNKTFMLGKTAFLSAAEAQKALERW